MKRARVAGGNDKREREFDLSEQAILKAEQFVKSFQQEAALNIPLKKVTTVQSMVAGRLKQSLLDLYAEDYQKKEAEGSSARDGMAILQRLRALQHQLDDCEQIVAAIVDAPVNPTDVLDAIDSLRDKGVVVTKSFATRAWGEMLQKAFDDSDYNLWFDTVLAKHLPNALVNSLSEGDITEYQERHVVDVLVKLMQGENNLERIRTLGVGQHIGHQSIMLWSD